MSRPEGESSRFQELINSQCGWYMKYKGGKYSTIEVSRGKNMNDPVSKT